MRVLTILAVSGSALGIKARRLLKSSSRTSEATAWNLGSAPSLGLKKVNISESQSILREVEDSRSTPSCWARAS